MYYMVFFYSRSVGVIADLEGLFRLMGLEVFLMLDISRHAIQLPSTVHIHYGVISLFY